MQKSLDPPMHKVELCLTSDLPQKHSPNKSECFLISEFSGRLITPTDELTGLPYCFAPNSNLPPVPPAGYANIDRPADWNHMMPKHEVRTMSDPRLGDLGKRALEGARVQWVDFDDHHYKYNFWFDGPNQPTTKEQLFKYLVMAEAGYIPEGSVDMSGESPMIKYLSTQERKDIWLSGQVRVYDSSVVRSYLYDYVLDHGINTFGKRDFDKLHKLLNTFDYDKRLFLGYSLAARMIEEAIEPICNTYSEARKEHALPEYLPNNPRDFIKNKLVSQRKIGKFICELSRIGGLYNRGELCIT